jgi:CAAX protease family protein
MAYALAWGAFLVIWLAARAAGVDDASELLSHVEALEFDAIPERVPLSPWVLFALSRIADFAFSIAGVVLISVTAGRTGLRELGRRLTRWRVPRVVAVTAVLPFILYLGATLLKVVSEPQIGNSLNLSIDSVSLALFSAKAGILFHLFFRGAFGEELGLRGFALPRLQARYGPVKSSLIVGTLWYLWHLPILVGRGPASLVLFGVMVMLLSFIFTWMFNGSGGSLLPGLLFHAFQNSEEVFEQFAPGLHGTNWETPASIGLLLLGIVITVRVVQSRRSQDVQ